MTLAFLLTAAVATHAQASEYPPKYAAYYFEDTYTAAGTPYNITGYAPSEPGGFPLHVFVQGTHPTPLSAWSLTVQQMAQYMAERGVVSASIWFVGYVFGDTRGASF